MNCPVEKEYGIKPCEIVRNRTSQGTVIAICLVCLKAQEKKTKETK